MPLYEFKCIDCGDTTEELYYDRSIAEMEPPFCCEKPMIIIISVNATPVIKGSRRGTFEGY